MIDKDKIATNISSILPPRPMDMNNDSTDARDKLVNASADKIVRKETAKDLALIKLREQQRLKKEKEKEEARIAAGIPLGRTALQHERITQEEEHIKQLEAIEAEVISPGEQAIINSAGKMSKRNVQELLALRGTTRPEVAKLLTSLNINTSIQLSKQDTANLLASLLTCNETQLNAVMNNKKVPVAIKIVIKRLLEDIGTGNMGTVEKLWDRIFGKNPLAAEATATDSTVKGLIPDVPISREAYLVLRETIIK